MEFSKLCSFEKKMESMGRNMSSGVPLSVLGVQRQFKEVMVPIARFQKRILQSHVVQNLDLDYMKL